MPILPLKSWLPALFANHDILLAFKYPFFFKRFTVGVDVVLVKCI